MKSARGAADAPLTWHDVRRQVRAVVGWYVKADGKKSGYLHTP